ncbi:hypothetical protein JCM5296_006442 [Sporobolomyces johnsonii]
MPSPFFLPVDHAFEVYLDPDYISSKNLVTTGGENDVEVVQVEDDRWETWEEFEELRRSRDYGDKTAKDKAKENKALQKEFHGHSKARARFDHIFLLMKKPWSSRLLLSSTQSADHHQVIFKGFDLENEEVIDGLLKKDGFLYEDGECPADPNEKKNKLLKGLIVRVFQGLLYGPQAIGQKPPYAGGKTPHGTLIGLKEITPVFVAAMHVLMSNALDDVDRLAPFSTQSTKRDKVHVKGKGPLKRTPELTPACYAKLYHKRCAMFNTTLTTAVGAKRLQELNDAVIPAIRGDQELSEEGDEAGQELEVLFADNDDGIDF